jgi:hypothetical protein
MAFAVKKVSDTADVQSPAAQVCDAFRLDRPAPPTLLSAVFSMQIQVTEQVYF